MSNSTNNPARTDSARMDYIDALRGGACLWVMLNHTSEIYHIAAGWQHTPLRILSNIAYLGWLGVSLFLVLSGFCLYFPLARRAASLNEIRLDAKSFFRRRATRILPTYYVALFIYIVAAALQSRHDGLPWDASFSGTKDIVLHILMLHNLRSSTLGSINGAFWSLALESQLYLIFPLLVTLAARRGLRAILLVTFAVAICWQAMAFHHLGFSSEWDPQLTQWYHALPGRAFEFAIGMSAAALVSRPISAKLMRQCALVLAILIVPAVYYTARISVFGPLLDQMWGIIFGCVLILLHTVPARHFRSNLALRFLTWTGVISYSVYLMHLLIFRYFPIPPASDLMLTSMLLVRFIGVLGVGLIFFVLFEQPFIRKRRKDEGLVEATVLSPAP